ncbi:MAG: Gmad2 immunoglobulin-like domain-containing protein [Flavobacterium sp.]|nr:Gmad2 immunoglobulin-like domain-containing protein [Flavobacterium sp.]
MKTSKFIFHRFCAIIVLWAFASCQSEKKKEEPIPERVRDTVTHNTEVAPVANKTFENQRFKDVTISPVSDTVFRIQGKGQIFEANFGWFIEDGHNILSEGSEMTDAGAPEWGSFDFTVSAKKARQNSTLHIVLFETSARDGSKQHELPIPLK